MGCARTVATYWELGPAHWISVVYDVEYGGEGMADAGVGGKRARE
jgi:hypothetical protein